MIWDYDSAVGQVNASYPYNFHEELLYQEVENVDRLLALATELNVKMTFACVGFAAEPGVFPYHIQDQLRRIRGASHEIASHSWRHEWFPYLENEQVRRSLRRSKEALEKCLGEPGAVKGFVPPFSRPMTWYARGAISFGDRSLSPFRVGGNIGSLCRELGQIGYSWCRVSYRSVLQRIGASSGRVTISRDVGVSGGVACVPHHYTGFDAEAIRLLDAAVLTCRPLVLVGHPSGLSRPKSESFEHLEPFLHRVEELQSAGRLRCRTVSEHLKLTSAEGDDGA